MVTAFGLEVNSPYKGLGHGVNISFWNSKLNKKVPEGGGTRYLNQSGGGFDIMFGNPGGAHTWGIEGPLAFDEVRVTFERGSTAPTVIPPFEISIAGFRYKLAK